jgi:hypothetical protein
MTLEGLFNKIKQIMESDTAKEDQRTPTSVEDPIGAPANSTIEEVDSRRYAHEDGDRENIAPSSQEPDGDVVEHEEGALPGCLEPDGGPEGLDKNIRSESDDTDGDPVDRIR